MNTQETTMQTDPAAAQHDWAIAEAKRLFPKRLFPGDVWDA